MLQKNNRVNFDGQLYAGKEAIGDNELLIAGKPGHVIYLQSETGKC
jgi:hypothetical protein